MVKKKLSLQGLEVKSFKTIPYMSVGGTVSGHVSCIGGITCERRKECDGVWTMWLSLDERCKEANICDVPL